MPIANGSPQPLPEPLANAVLHGLVRHPKSLPAWLLYDAPGSALYERITELPEYYLTRAEREILETHADDIVERAAHGGSEPLMLSELGAGTATKSQLLLAALLRRQPSATFLLTDISIAALSLAESRLHRQLPRARVQTVIGPHEEALTAMRAHGGRQLALFIGSSIGNFEGAAALAFLQSIRGALRPGSTLLLGTDLRKDVGTLLAAYDDAEGVTAAFNRNVLARINRDLGGRFDLDRFHHVALWNEADSRIEMHLESGVDQIVPIAGLDREIAFRRGERIHTESSVKYDEAMAARLLTDAGFSREHTWYDRGRRFAVHLARVRPRSESA